MVKSECRPFLKWVGGKRAIAHELLARIPDSFDGYHEPFMGGAAPYLALQPGKAFLSDVNPHLVATFAAVRDEVEAVIGNLRIHRRRHSPEHYTSSREALTTAEAPAKLAALFIYLNKTCFNGLYRVNRSGRFNVPMGRYENPAILDEDNLRRCSTALQNVRIDRHGFEDVPIIPGDFYYLDPPYHGTYDGYPEAGFGESEQSTLSPAGLNAATMGGVKCSHPEWVGWS